MALLVHRDVQHSERWVTRVFLREINSRLRELAQTLNVNRRESHPSVSLTTAANATTVVWLPNEAFDLESVNVYGTTAAGTVTPQINGVAVGGAPFNVTTTATNHPITSPNSATALDRVELLTAGLTGTMTASLNLRRVN